MSVNAQPLVSIGMPVYNGAEYLRGAIESLLAQDYSHFELTISDNNSSDGTADICRDFAAADSRVRYVRQAENHGSPWNFVYVLGEAKGDYFMWAAHDDLWDAAYIRKCLAMLEAHPEAVLCATEVHFIDAVGNPSPIYREWTNIETPGMTPVERVHRLIAVMGWYSIYGLLRPEAIRKMKHLGESGFGCDVVLLMELILSGHFVKVPEPLFSCRIAKMKTAADFQADFDGEKVARPASPVPYSGLAAALLATVYESALSPEEKTAAFADFMVTMSAPGIGWRRAISAELLGPRSAPNDAAFAYLLGQLLARSVPLTEIPRNPLVQALIPPPPTVPDVLTLARRIAGCAKPDQSAQAAEKQRQAVLSFEQGQLDESSRLFSEALKMEESVDRWVNWATTQIARGRLAEAEQGLRRAIALEPGHPLATLKLGLLIAGEGRCADAIPFLERALSSLSGSKRADAERLIEECRAGARTPRSYATQLS